MRKYDLKIPKLKKDMVESLYKFSEEKNLFKDKISQLKFILNQDFFISENIYHELYKENFNFVDIIDKYYYKVEDHHHYWNWKFKMVKVILKLCIYNAWVMSSEYFLFDLLEFRDDIASTLLKSNIKKNE